MDELRKNAEYECSISGCTGEGLGVARIGGRAVFVHDALPGEDCHILILRVSRTAVYGKVLERRSVSPHRIVPDCPHYGKCGGCDWRHTDYAGELLWKLQRVNDAFQRIGGLDLRAERIVPAPSEERYRAKVIFAVGQDANGKPVTGFYRARSHEIIPVEDCCLQHTDAGKAAKALRDWMENYRIPAWDEEKHRGLVKHLFVRSGMVCVVAAGRPLREKELVTMLLEALPYTKSIVWNENRSEGNAVLSGNFRTLYGSDTVEVTLSGLKFRLSPRSFFQVNPAQAETLYALAVEAARLTGAETVIDLYCGAGAIGLLAAPKAKEVVGVEVVPSAVEDAAKTAALAGIRNASFLCADAAEAAAQFAEEGWKPDVLFVDPPRKGLAPSVIGSIAEMSPQRVVYVSCDPGTLARDLKLFAEKGYAAETAVAVDMFPRTRHVETVCLLVLRNPVTHVDIDVDVEELVQGKRGQATYEQIRDYVMEQTGLHVTNLNIAQIKRKCGIIERENYNLPKSEDSKQPQCPPEKEAAIKEALKHFGMI